MFFSLINAFLNCRCTQKPADGDSGNGVTMQISNFSHIRDILGYLKAVCLPANFPFRIIVVYRRLFCMISLFWLPIPALILPLSLASHQAGNQRSITGSGNSSILQFLSFVSSNSPDDLSVCHKALSHISRQIAKFCHNSSWKRVGMPWDVA
jgi:hypothetical protein